jgi:broad specificity phosphatase PhoE
VSDLQCAATLVFVVPPASGNPASGDAGPGHAALVDALRERRCAVVYAGESADAMSAAEALADGLGLDVRPETRLHRREEEEQDADAVARVCGLLGEIADEHRGETVAVVAAAPLLQRALPTLAVNVPPRYGERLPLEPGEAAEMRVDADAWVLTAWNGRRLDDSPDE